MLSKAAWAFLLILAVIGRVAASVATNHHFDWPTDKRNELKDEISDIDDRIKDAELAFREILSEDEALEFLDLLIDPGLAVVRITESIDLSQNVYVSDSTRTVLVPRQLGDDGAPRRVLVPVLHPKRGSLVDKLSVTVDSQPVRTLSHRESHGAVICAVKILLKMSFPNDKPIRDELFKSLRQHMISDVEVTDTSQLTLIKSVRDAASARMGSGGDSAKLASNALVGIIQRLLCSYLVVAVIDDIKISRSYIKLRCVYAAEKQRISGLGWLKKLHGTLYHFLRTCFGLTARSHVLRLVLATEAQSYHLRTEVPNGMYVYEHRIDLAEVQTRDVSVPFPQDNTRAIDPDLRLSSTRGQAHVHVYARDLDVLTARQAQSGELVRIPILTLELRERPPGLLFTVWFLSMFLAVLTLGVGIYHNLVFGIDIQALDHACLTPDRESFIKNGGLCDLTRTVSSGWPTLLFGIPALVSGWLVSRFTEDAVSRLSLSTIAVTGWFIFNAVSAVVLSALKFGILMIAPTPILNTIVTQPLWSLLIISCTGSAAMCSLLLFFRVRRYVERVLSSKDSNLTIRN